MKKEIFIAKIECSALLAFTFFITSCLASVSPQIINSYPLAIDFESYAKTSSAGPTLPAQPQVWPQVSIAQQSNSQPNPKSPRVISAANYQKRSQIALPVSRQQSQMQNWAPSAKASDRMAEASVYQKRTLPTDTPNGGDKKSHEDKINTEASKNNTTDNQETRRLLLLRQKMIDMQGRINVSIEDTNWKIAAGCLSSQSGNQFIRNKDVKCAASQVVLSISRMQRASCKQCETYFHCEGFANALKRCKDNYDVQDTLSVMRSCQGLINDDFESVQATRAPSQGVDCQKSYLCGRNCNYNPADGTCPRNNCNSPQVDENMSQYKYYLRSRRGRPTTVAYPAGSPIKSRIVDRKN